MQADYIARRPRRAQPSPRAAEFYDWLQHEPGRTIQEIMERYELPQARSVENLLLECEKCGLLVWEGELPPGYGRPQLAFYALEAT